MYEWECDGELPLIETVPVIDIHVNGLCRLDRLGSEAALTYCGLRIDPHINQGRLFRTPIVRLTQPFECINAQKGTVTRWVESGETSLLIPIRPAKLLLM